MEYKDYFDKNERENMDERMSEGQPRGSSDENFSQQRPRVYGQVSGQSAQSETYVQGTNPVGESALNQTYQRVEPSPSFPQHSPQSAGGYVNVQNPYYEAQRAGSAPEPIINPIPAPQPCENTVGGSASETSGASVATASAPKPMSAERKRFILLVVIIIVAMISSGFLGASLSRMNGGAVGGSGAQSEIKITPSSSTDITEAVAQKVLDSVVGITSTVQTEGGSFFGYNLGPQENSGVGTGMIVDAKGYVLTNSHVVLDGTVDKIEVLLSDGTTVEGKVLWSDKSIDLAIVKIDPKDKTLKPVELGDSNKVKIGQYVAAIGNPLGLNFNGSVTQGILSGLNRSITVTDGQTQSTMDGLMQVDAAINRGNSGGPLLDKEGKVIGVNTAKADAEGMGFCIPINTAKPIVEKVIETGSFERVYMGVSAADAATIAAEYPNLGLDKDVRGAFITAISADSPAATAGMKMKDVITKVNDTKIETASDLIKAMLNYAAGDTVTITYIRDGKEAQLPVKLATQTDVYGEWQKKSQSQSGGTEGSDPGTGSNGGSDDNGGTGNGGGSQVPDMEIPGNPFGDWK